MILDLIPGGPILTFTTADLDPLRIGGYRCPRGCKISIVQEKMYTVTKVPGRDGSVKEYSGLDDFKLTIEFLYVGINKLLAQKELLQIKKIWRKEESLEVFQSKVNKLGIKYLFLTRIDFPDEDRLHELPVRLEAISDDPDIDLTKKDEESLLSVSSFREVATSIA